MVHSAPVVELHPRRRASPGGGKDSLIAVGLTAEAADALLPFLRKGLAPAEALASALEVREVHYPQAGVTAVVSVFGASGAGKTTALMRMALDCADSGRPALLVAADNVRMGARQQLHAFGEALGIPVEDAYEDAEVLRIAAEAEPGTCLFVDAASTWEPGEMPADIGSFHYLALPCHWHAKAVERALTGLAEVEFDGCILTFTDLSGDIAPVMSLVLESPLGIAFASSSRDVSTGVEAFDPLALASGMFPGSSGDSTDGRRYATG